MTRETAQSILGRRAIGWTSTGALLVAVAVLLAVEPMRWSLPPRFLFSHLDIQRTGTVDFTMCMRAKLSPAEAHNFAERRFEPRDRIARKVEMSETMCTASFWPSRFTALTLGYSPRRWPDGTVEGTSGAVYDNGYLYFWSNSM